MQYRELQVIDLKISQKLILILLIIPAIIALSVIPIFFVPILSYFTLYETWGIDNTFIGIFFVMFFPFWFEILTGTTGKQPLSIEKMELVRNSYRFSYLVIHISSIVSIIWQDIRGVWVVDVDPYPLILFFEFIVIIRERFLIPLNRTNGFERKYVYILYLAFLIMSFLIIPGFWEL